MNTTPLAHFETECIEPYEAMICIIIATVVEIFGNGLLILVLVYEKFTMDPQKRTIINQLVSHACLWLLLHNIIGIPILTCIIVKNDSSR